MYFNGLIASSAFVHKNLIMEHTNGAQIME